MKVLVACEMSGIVRRAFRREGHEAWSCDLLPSLDDSEFHIIDDVLKHLDDGWDLMIAHPPCTALAVAGNGTYASQPEVIWNAVNFVLRLYEAPIPKIAIENPVGRLSTYWRRPNQYVQPWMFGHKETKKTGFWLKNLPVLRPTNVVDGPYEQRIWKMGPSKNRSMLRSLTYEGIADAMAKQWGVIE